MYFLRLGIGAISEAESGKGAITEQRTNAEMFQDLSVANESDELIFPGLELCFNQMDCLHASFFSGVFVASMAYRSRD